MLCYRYLRSIIFCQNNLQKTNFSLTSQLYSTMKCKISVIQMRSTNDKENNFNVCQSFINEAKSNGSQIVFLPECFDFIGENAIQTYELSEFLNGPLIQKYKDLAKSQNLYLSLGGFHSKMNSDDKRINNSHLMIDSKGEIVAKYDKMHLFDINIPDNVTLQESKSTKSGNQIVKPVKTPAGRVGLAICYDLRFPELSSALCNQGCDVLTYPSAFSVPTGIAHWHVLLRARAIENRCYVVAAAQCGAHNAKRVSYGHSLIIDPHGKILAEQTEETESVIHCTLDLGHLKELRCRDRMIRGKDSANFSMLETLPQELLPLPYKPIEFGGITVNPQRIFYHSRHVIAFLAHNPIRPGHVMIIPKHYSSESPDLSTKQMELLYNTVKEISEPLKRITGATAFNYSQQSGHFAGQRIPHVHLHMLPRKEGDFKNSDKVYPMLFKHDVNILSNPDHQYDISTLQELRTHFYPSDDNTN